MKITMGKEYRTTEHEKVRIDTIDGEGLYPVRGAVLLSLISGPTWVPSVWTADGKDSEENMYRQVGDLVETPQIVHLDFWFNVFPDRVASYLLRQSADYPENAEGRLACINIKRTVTEGEGLDIA